MDKNDELLDLNDSGLVPCESHSVSQPSSELNLYSSFIGKMDTKTYFFRELTETKCLYTPDETKLYVDNLKAHLNHLSSRLSFGKNTDSLPIINDTDIISESDIIKIKHLNILMTGEIQSGKSTFLNRIISKLQKETKFKHSFYPSDSYSTKRICITYNDNIQSNITLIEGKGFNSQKEHDCQAYIQALKYEIYNKNNKHSQKTFSNQKLGEDSRIHIILFFSKDYYPNYNKNVLIAIKLLSQCANVVPIISKKEKKIIAYDDNDYNRSKQTFREILKYNQMSILDISEEYSLRTNKEKDEDLSPPFEFFIDSKVHQSKSNTQPESDFTRVYYLLFHFYPFSIYKNQFYSKFKETISKATMKTNNIVIEKNIFYSLTFAAAFVYLLFYFKHRTH